MMMHAMLLMVWVANQTPDAAKPPPPASVASSKCAVSAINFEGFTADLRYVGGCANGKAQGQGVVRAYRGQEVVAFFYGDWQSGQPRFGIVERPAQGYIVVEQVGGTLKSTDDRNAMIRAFASASQAATAASNAFLAQGNRASAEHYAATAKRLAEQVD